MIHITVKPSLTCLAHRLLLDDRWKHPIGCCTGQHPSCALSQRSPLIQLRFQSLILLDVFFPVLTFESRFGISDRSDQLHVWVLDMLIFLLTLEIVHCATQRVQRNHLRVLDEVWLLLNWLLDMVIYVCRQIFRIDWHHNMFGQVQWRLATTSWTKRSLHWVATWLKKS